MSLLELNLDDAQEPKVVDANEEYKLRIIDCTKDVNKKGNKYILPRFEVVDEPLAKDFTKYLGLPHDEMKAKELNRCKWGLVCFFDAFGVDHSKPVDPEDDLVGQTGWAILGIEDNEAFGEQNYVKKFIAPRA